MADSDVILQIRLNLTGKGSSVPDCHIFHFKEVFGSLYPRILSNLKLSKIDQCRFSAKRLANQHAWMPDRLQASWDGFREGSCLKGFLPAYKVVYLHAYMDARLFIGILGFL